MCVVIIKKVNGTWAIIDEVKGINPSLNLIIIAPTTPRIVLTFAYLVVEYLVSVSVNLSEFGSTECLCYRFVQ